jgi:tetratricopeptide (TPR) repeat protein
MQQSGIKRRFMMCVANLALLKLCVLAHSKSSDCASKTKHLKSADRSITDSSSRSLAAVSDGEMMKGSMTDVKPKIRILQRPPFLKHVTKEQIQSAIEVAEQRHKITVQRALATYPVWKSTDWSVKTHDVQLKELSLQNDPTNCLPDYGDVIPTTVYVTDPPILSREDCFNVIRNAEHFFEEKNSGTWTRQKSGQYEVCGFDIHEIPSVKEWFIRTAEEILLPLLQQTFSDFCGTSVTDLCIDNAYLFKYTPDTGRRTDIHTDSGCLSFTIALSSPETDYEGGGTWFHGLQQHSVPSDINNVTESIEIQNASVAQDGNVLSMDIGQITVRPGGVKHCGYAVKRGTRYIIGGFCIHRTRPEHVRMLLQPSTSYDSSQQVVDQQLLLEAAIVLNPGCTAAYTLLANHYIQSGNISKAQKILDYCIHNVDPKSSEVAYALASIYLDQQMYETALHHITVCLKIDPHDVEAIMMSAMIFSILGDSQKEASCYQDIIDIPDAKPSIKASAYCNLGVLHQGEDLELEYYRQSLICQPRTFSATYSLASALASRKHWKDAIELFRQAIEDLNDGPNAQANEAGLNRRKALRSLYTATMQFIKEEQELSLKKMSHNEMMQYFQNIMGIHNFKELRKQKGQ